MLILKTDDLSFRIASGLAADYPGEQFLPNELNDALLAVINSVGLAALNIAVANTQTQIDAGTTPEKLESTQELETVERFATEHIPRHHIVSLIDDMSGVGETVANEVLSLVEREVDEAVFGLRGLPPSPVDFEGLGIISAGAGELSYHITLTEALHIPPLKHLSVWSELLRRGESASGASPAVSTA
jgi:hypothetical protein